MKTLILIAAFLLSVTFASAQSDLTSDIQKGIYMLDTMKTEKTNEQVVSHFEKVALSSINWEAKYYAAYSNLLLGVGKKDQESKDELFSKALKYVNKADSINANNSEINTLKGYILFMQMSVYPQQRAMSLIPEANTLFEKAISLDPENPRPYLLKGISLFYVPGMFGGDKEQAKVVLTTAKAKFDKYTAKNLQPNWGKAKVEELLKQL
jgi:tetratricopeptide (TPR) repeat protein